MTNAERNRFGMILNTKQIELTKALAKRDDITIERTADAFDETQLAAQRELTTRNLERDTKVLHEVRAAQERIGDGTFGVCLQCEEEISPKRLNAMPWATLCIVCQVRVDRYEEPNSVPPQIGLMDAA